MSIPYDFEVGNILLLGVPFGDVIGEGSNTDSLRGVGLFLIALLYLSYSTAIDGYFECKKFSGSESSSC